MNVEKAVGLVIDIHEKAKKLDQTYQEFLTAILKRIKL